MNPPVPPNSSNRCWAIVPAAGVGRRMGGDLPKQYLGLLDRPLIEHTLMRLGDHPRIHGLVVALSAGDEYWSTVRIETACSFTTTIGGDERCHSVLAALDALRDTARPDEWVLVHDAARPCIHPDDIDRLIDTVERRGASGGLLGLPVSDTVKRTGADGLVTETVDRQGLWRAATPQMFRYGELRVALHAAIAAGELVTDEAAAMERSGIRPLMVEGRADNIKVTRPGDLELAALFISQQAFHHRGSSQ